MVRFIALYIIILNICVLGENNISSQFNASGNNIQIELNLVNSDTLSGMQIPVDLGLSKLGLRIDSVSFADSRIEHFYEYFYTENADSSGIFIFILDSADPEIESTPLLPGSGKIATIYLSCTRDPRVDSHSLGIKEVRDRKRRLTFDAWDPTGNPVEIELTPLRLDVRRE